MENTVYSAIEESIGRNQITHIDAATPAVIDDLKYEAEEYVQNDEVLEAWGADEDGNTWRVHAVLGVAL